MEARQVLCSAEGIQHNSGCGGYSGCSHRSTNVEGMRKVKHITVNVTGSRTVGRERVQSSGGNRSSSSGTTLGTINIDGTANV